MAPRLSEEEIDDLVYFSRTGEDADLMESVTVLAEREKVAPAVILMATKDEGKSTVLHMATGNGHLETVRKVIQCFDGRPKEEKQAFLDEPNEHGNTGMHWAALGGHLDTVKLLMEHGASPALANERDYVPLDLANQNEKTEVSQYFLSFLKQLESENTDEGLNNAAASIEVEETAEESKPEASS
ncbi:hypothetical protein LLEC1_04983 [Akanthomyces lecanii]|uniref:Uncharacterized protein n=1 Tax=Cordyceps confragosa TaxID=2714763 RepID=A0A179I1Q2_CORDF|nr:hypothetical protein LLEC1_04983 [Akanthomyces lecanii]